MFWGLWSSLRDQGRQNRKGQVSYMKYTCTGPELGMEFNLESFSQVWALDGIKFRANWSEGTIQELIRRIFSGSLWLYPFFFYLPEKLGSFIGRGNVFPKKLVSILNFYQIESSNYLLCVLFILINRRRRKKCHWSKRYFEILTHILATKVWKTYFLFSF